MKTLTETLALLLILTAMSISATELGQPTKATQTWTVDDDGPADFQTIQEAINAANPRDTIFVRNGTYFENIVISKTLSLIGEYRDATIVDGNYTNSVIRINRADNVSVVGFTIQNSALERHLFETSGIFLYYASGTLIQNNKVSNNEVGIYFYVSSSSVIKENLVTNNLFYGILMDYSPGPPKNVLSNNILADNGFGIGFDTSYGHNINNNIIANSTWSGIYIFANSHNNTLTENTVIRASNGIVLQESNGILLDGNVILNSTWNGIYLLSSSFNNINANMIKNNYNGVYFRDNSNNTLAANLFSSNAIGVRLRNSENNIIHHNNFINNSDSALFEDSIPPPNSWDNSYPAGGNHWDDYGGIDLYTGPHQNITGSDDIGDTHYIVASSNIDQYPLMHPQTLSLRFHDVAMSNVTLSTTEVYVGRMVILSVTVQNRGTFIENFTVRGSYDLDGNTNIIATINVANLNPNANATLKVGWKPLDVGDHRLKFYTSKLIGDVNPLDNTSSEIQVKVKMQGDIDGDGKVNINDLAIVARAFGSFPSHPRWNPKADFNEDYKVNIRDLVQVAKNFRQPTS